MRCAKRIKLTRKRFSKIETGIGAFLSSRRFVPSKSARSRNKLVYYIFVERINDRSMETDEFDYLVVARTHSGPLLSNDGNALLIGVSIRRFEEPTAAEVCLFLYRARLGGDRRVDGPDADGPAAKVHSPEKHDAFGIVNVCSTCQYLGRFIVHESFEHLGVYVDTKKIVASYRSFLFSLFYDRERQTSKFLPNASTSAVSYLRCINIIKDRRNK